MNSVIGSLPYHQYVWVDTAFTHREPQGFLPAVWFGLVSFPGRMWGCNVLFENGAIYRNVPVHALASSSEPAKTVWTAQEAQQWDCYGHAWSAVRYEYLRSLRCQVKAKDSSHRGSYLCTVAPIGDAFSEAPDQSKEFTFVELENGRYTVQPTDRIIFEERSFTRHNWEWPTGFKRQTEIYSCE
jgi:hypothetical protein